MSRPRAVRQEGAPCPARHKEHPPAACAQHTQVTVEVMLAACPRARPCEWIAKTTIMYAVHQSGGSRTPPLLAMLPSGGAAHSPHFVRAASGRRQTGCRRLRSCSATLRQTRKASGATRTGDRAASARRPGERGGEEGQESRRTGKIGRNAKAQRQNDEASVRSLPVTESGELGARKGPYGSATSVTLARSLN